MYLKASVERIETTHFLTGEKQNKYLFFPDPRCPEEH
jgi:hypothetical protein